MLQACKMEGFPLVPPVSTGTPLLAGPAALRRPPAAHQATDQPAALPGSLSVGSWCFLPGAPGLRPSEGAISFFERAPAG